MTTTQQHTTDHTSRTHDVVIVGARCAGAATAMLLAERGHDVVVVDRAALPSDTLSTHSIARGGVVQLQRWGLLDTVLASGAPALRTAVFHSDGSTVVRTIKDRAGVDLGVAPRRHILDGILADAAVTAGATLHTRFTVTGSLRADHGRIMGVVGHGPDGPLELRARIVVGADGVRSRLARDVGAPLTLARQPTGATYYAYYAGSHWDAVEYFLGHRRFSGIFPTHDGEACVWACLPAQDAARLRSAGRPHETFDRILEQTPELADRLLGARRTSAPRGAAELPNQLRQPVGPGWALVGDAGYHRDPITGHGITDAFRDAELLSDAIDDALSNPGDEVAALAEYETERNRMARPIFDLTCQLGRFPATERFVELQRQLREAIDDEAVGLAARPTALAAAA